MHWSEYLPFQEGRKLLFRKAAQPLLSQVHPSNQYFVTVCNL
uniref:Uncharacterized protein n=1 Tax=Aegilops tauschii subsp. strangulata TaxID=200361 RepID=A0A453SJH8_AEGTS